MGEITHYFAVDLGATSGRTILGSLDSEVKTISLREITRFPNEIIRLQGHSYWNLPGLFHEIIKGLKKVAAEGISIASIGIDTWGVDFALFGKDGSLLRNPYSYRDAHTEGAPERFFKKMALERVYEITGIQVMNFNSLFQLDTLQTNGCSALEAAHKILFTPDALGYMLTGEQVMESTIASTSQMADARNGLLHHELLATLGLPADKFGRFVRPGQIIGTLTAELQQLTGLGPVPVVAVAGHDTASAVVAVPAQHSEFAYLSSGTWSLMGVELDTPVISNASRECNFTNEGGVDGTIRFLKNICGMWLLESCRREWKDAGEDTDYDTLVRSAIESEAFRSLINPDDPVFANPVSMQQAIRDYCERTAQPVPDTKARITRCIFDSLACRYRQVFDMLTDLTGQRPKVLHIIGGGSRNKLLNRFTANALGVPVIAGPAECTAMGNIMMQAKAGRLVDSLGDIRNYVVNSVETEKFEPRDPQVWAQAYRKYLTITA